MVFYSKKSKKEVRDRRRKATQAKKRKKLGSRNDKNVDGNDYEEQNVGEISKGNHQPKVEANNEDTSSTSFNDDNDTNKFVAKNGKYYIRLPSGMDTKEAKKFRKDCRRKIRKQETKDTSTQEKKRKAEHMSDGKDYVEDDNIIFLRHDEEIPDESSNQSSNGTSNNDADQNPMRKKKKKSFVCINDLVAEEKRLKEVAAIQEANKASLNSLSDEQKSQYVALDCEMVGVGPGGKRSALARVSLVNFDGDVLLDTFVQVPEKVTDFRTKVSGVRAKDIKVSNLSEPMELKDVRMKVGNLMLKKILVGHGLRNDLKCLLLDHPKNDIRDTAKYNPFMKKAGENSMSRNGGSGKKRARKLKDLAKEYCNIDIQIEGQSHCSIDDARAAMELYKVVWEKWEQEISSKYRK